MIDGGIESEICDDFFGVRESVDVSDVSFEDAGVIWADAIDGLQDAVLDLDLFRDGLDEVLGSLDLILDMIDGADQGRDDVSGVGCGFIGDAVFGEFFHFKDEWHGEFPLAFAISDFLEGMGVGLMDVLSRGIVF